MWIAAAVMAASVVGAAVRAPEEVLTREPRRVHHVEPVYPPAAMAAQEEADVTFSVHTDGSGRVTRVGPLMSLEPFTGAAAAAIRRWRYEPAPHTRSFPVTVRFRLPGKPIHALPTPVVLDRYNDRGPGSEAYRVRAEAGRELRDRGVAILPDLVQELRGADHLRRCAAAGVLSALGAEAVPAVPALVEALRHAPPPEERVYCGLGDALRAIDPAAFAAEVDRAVRERNSAQCRALLEGVSYRGDVPEPVLAALAFEACAEAAAAAVGQVTDRGAAPALVAALASGSALVRSKMIEALGRIVEAAPSSERAALAAVIVPRAVAALSDADVDVREAAAGLLEGLAPEAADAVAALAARLEDASRRVRFRAAQALAAMGTTARAAAPALLKALDAPLPPLSDPRGGPADEQLKDALKAAIASTGAGKDDALLAKEDEIRAVAVAHAVAEPGASGAPAPGPFAVSVLKARGVSPGLLAALARRGLAPASNSQDARVSVHLGEVTWMAGDLARVEVQKHHGHSGAFGACTVALDGGAWRVVACPLHGSYN